MKSTVYSTSLRMILLALCLSLVWFTDAQCKDISRKQDSIKFEEIVIRGGCRGCDLRGYDFSKLDISGFIFNDSNLQKAKFFLSDATNTKFINCRLDGAIFDGADISYADFTDATLYGASFSGVYRKGAIVKLSKILINTDHTERLQLEEPEEFSGKRNKSKRLIKPGGVIVNKQ